ncbi:MAG TPA: flavin reductase family protein [Candidatus Acidoferrales bacterium]|nr:flavin reductase family protein [Candidatus Acidoferrales bacterium]
MPVSPNNFKAGMRRFATGVTVVTTVGPDGHVHGFTANAFASVTADPPMLLICVNRSAQSHPLISSAGRFCVNVLSLDQQEIAERFARSGIEDRFGTIEWRPGETGSPIIAGTLAHFDCTLAEEHTAGTHTIFIGTVVDCSFAEGAPLGYFDGAYRNFTCATS